jgi:hypothetical protein
MVAATRPNCTIYLIEANGLDQTDLLTANATAVSLGAHIVSDAWGCNYYGCVDKSYFDAKGVTYVALGSVPQPTETFLADFDSVVAVGGTFLTQAGGGKRGWKETIWNGAGGGCSTDVPKPPWQNGTKCSGRVSMSNRGVLTGLPRGVLRSRVNDRQVGKRFFSPTPYCCLATFR